MISICSGFDLICDKQNFSRSYGVCFLNEVVPKFLSAALEHCRKSCSGVARASGTVVRRYECTNQKLVDLP